MKKEETISGEFIMEKLTPELTKIFNSLPNTDAPVIRIEVTIENHRITGATFKYFYKESDDPPAPDTVDFCYPEHKDDSFMVIE